MITMTNHEGARIEAETEEQAEAVQASIAGRLKAMLPSLQAAELLVALPAAERCNRLLDIARQNEEAIAATRDRRYINDTEAAAKAFIDHFRRQ